MIDEGKHDLLGVAIDAVDYDAACERIIAAAREREPFAVSALAVHGIIEGVNDPELLHRLNDLDVVTPDGQAVRWALNWLHGTTLTDRCYGPTLMLRLCAAAADAGLAIHLYGSVESTLTPLVRNLETRFPDLTVADAVPSQFARVSSDDLDAIAARITASGARLVFVGLGCPRQEVFAYEIRTRVSMPVVAVGAAFDYHAGLLVEPPAVVQRLGLQWLWRLVSEPRRLWRRYLSTNPKFVAGVLRQRRGAYVATQPAVPTAEVGHA